MYPGGAITEGNFENHICSGWDSGQTKIGRHFTKLQQLFHSWWDVDVHPPHTHVKL